jgi:NAD(P)-dependent dehydrogenase (short-subunit alcohol dehydrogenase family)
VANTHPDIEAFVADAANPADAKKTVDRAMTLWGRIDALVNNAGAGGIMPLDQADCDKIAAIFSTNVFGPTLLTSAALPHLQA